MAQVFLRRIIDEKTASVLDDRDDLRRHVRGDGRTAKRSAHHTVFVHHLHAHIIGAMDNDSPFPGVVVETLVDTFDPQGTTIDAHIST